MQRRPMIAGAPPEGPFVYSVSDFTREVRSLLESSYPELWIEGEVANLSTPASGHSYFSIKDDQSQIRCALFRQKKLRCAAAPKNGAQVLIRARVSLYGTRGDLQLIVEYLEDAGEGALRRAMEALKRGLREEGLFNPEHKLAIPEVPRRVGVVTSATGAALRDILTTLRRTSSWLPVVIYPVPVQGVAAAPAIVKALDGAARRGECNVLILARGGGSLEDLQAFNEESVARAVFACPIPLVSGVGHETDTTIVDFVADARAATPTAAAQLIAGAGERLSTSNQELGRRLLRATGQLLQRMTQDVDRVAGRIRHPLERIQHQLSRVDFLRERLAGSMSRRISTTGLDLNSLERRLHRAAPTTSIPTLSRMLGEREARLLATIKARIASSRQALDYAERQLASLGPMHTLARGYAILHDRETGMLVKSVEQTRASQPLSARLVDGALQLRVEESESE